MQQSIAGKKKAKEVTMETWIEMVKQTQQYKSGECVREAAEKALLAALEVGDE